MRRIVLWLAATTTIVVLLFGYHTSTNRTEAATPPATVTPSESSGPSGSTGSSSSSGLSGSASSGSRTSAGATKTATGSVARTRWGPVQVELTVVASKITKVDVVQTPDGNHRDEEINAYAIPTLVQETLSAQSARIDMVSGATVTSEGYLQSLQSALDKAGI